MKNTQRGMTLIETSIGCLLSAIMMLGVTSTAQQSQKSLSSEGFRTEMQQKGRAAIDMLSNYVRSAGADRAGIFSVAPYTTASILPIPSASDTAFRLRSDFNDDGVLTSSLPEDVSVSWNADTQMLTIGPTQYDHVTSLAIRYYDAAGADLTPPSGGWDIASSAADGDTLRSITRIQVEMQFEGRHVNALTNQTEQMTVTSDITVTNQRL